MVQRSRNERAINDTKIYFTGPLKERKVCHKIQLFLSGIIYFNPSCAKPFGTHTFYQRGEGVEPTPQLSQKPLPP